MHTCTGHPSLQPQHPTITLLLHAAVTKCLHLLGISTDTNLYALLPQDKNGPVERLVRFADDMLYSKPKGTDTAVQCAY